jgi:hypothetical protein
MVLGVTGIESVFICINELKKAQRLSSLLKKDPDLDLQKAIEKKENPSNLKKIFSAVVRIVGASFGTEKSAFEKNTYIIGKHPDYLPAYKDKIQPEARGNCFLNGATEGTAKLLITQGATMLLTKSQENASIKEKLQSSGKLKAEYDTLCALTKTGTTIPEFLSNQVASQTYQDLLEKTQQNALEKKQPYRWAGMNIIDKIAKSFLRNSFSISHTRTPGIMSALSPIKMKLSQTVGKFIYGGTSSDAKE